MHTCTVSYFNYKALNMAELINCRFLITATGFKLLISLKGNDKCNVADALGVYYFVLYNTWHQPISPKVHEQISQTNTNSLKRSVGFPLARVKFSIG